MKDFNIPLLTAEDIDCRVQSVSKAKNGTVGAVLLLYKDARVDMRILDQVFGPGNWQRTHEVINGNLFCNIDIWDDEKALPADFVVETVTTKPDKTAIKKAIQSGQEVSGASLVENRNLQIK